MLSDSQKASQTNKYSEQKEQEEIKNIDVSVALPVHVAAQSSSQLSKIPLNELQVSTSRVNVSDNIQNNNTKRNEATISISSSQSGDEEDEGVNGASGIENEIKDNNEEHKVTSFIKQLKSTGNVNVTNQQPAIVTPLNHQTEKKSSAVNDLLSPLPLIPQGKKYREDLDEVKWRKKRLKQNQTISKKSRQQNNNAHTTLSSQDLGMDEAANQENFDDIQNRLEQFAEQITVQQEQQINLEEYPKYFKYQIYESFKPQTLSQARNYMNFIISNKDSPVPEDELSPELYNYLSKETDTVLPSVINQKNLLQFDSNFESGNLDSVYLANEQEYNLLMKVDTNSKGNTHWFYFKVLNGLPGMTVTFNLLNFCRDLAGFYNRGMNVLNRYETTKGEVKSEWQTDKCVVIDFKSQNDIIRSYKKDQPGVPARYYSTLTFKYTFTEDLLGNVVCFSYALPYTYTDLLSDLELAKSYLLSNGGKIYHEVGLNNKKKQNNENMVDETPQAGGGPAAANNGEETVTNKQQKERKPLTKHQLQELEYKRKARNVAKGQMGEFELKMLSQEVIGHLDFALQSIENQKKLEIVTPYLYYKQEVVSQSVGGLNIYQLTITKRSSAGAVRSSKKKCVYINCRLHAGETHGSFIMSHLIKELTQNYEKYDDILHNSIIRLVPMINVDGSVIGNARCSLVGLDLNRRWCDPNPVIHPEIFFLKGVMEQQAKSEQGISVFCDLHGHNKKDNCFFYGCNKAADEGILSWTKTRLLPKIFAAVEPIFNYNDCRFKQDKFKLNTARVVVWNEMKVTNSFTLETSMYAISEMNDRGDVTSIRQFKKEELYQIGQSFLATISTYQKLEKELEEEFKTTNGWLKAQKLKEVSGEAARDKITRANTMAREKERYSKKDAAMNLGGTTTSSAFTGKGISFKATRAIDSSDTNEEKRKNILAQYQASTDTLKHPLSHNYKANQSFKSKSKDNSNRVSNLKNQSFKKRQNFGVSQLSQEMSRKVTETRVKSGEGSIKPLNTEEDNNASSALNDDNIAVVDNAAEQTQLDKESKSKQQFDNLSRWRDFFGNDEIQLGIKETNKQPKENDPDDLSSESSDSQPSVDNLDIEEIQQFFKPAMIEKKAKVEEREEAKLETNNKKWIQMRDENQQTMVDRAAKEAKQAQLEQERLTRLKAQEEAQKQENDEHYNFTTPYTVYHHTNQYDPYSHISQKKNNYSTRINILSAQLNEIERLRHTQNSQLNALKSAAPPSGSDHTFQNMSFHSQQSNNSQNVGISFLPQFQNQQNPPQPVQLHKSQQQQNLNQYLTSGPTQHQMTITEGSQSVLPHQQSAQSQQVSKTGLARQQQRHQKHLLNLSQQVFKPQQQQDSSTRNSRTRQMPRYQMVIDQSSSLNQIYPQQQQQTQPPTRAGHHNHHHEQSSSGLSLYHQQRNNHYPHQQHHSQQHHSYHQNQHGIEVHMSERQQRIITVINNTKERNTHSHNPHNQQYQQYQNPNQYNHQTVSNQNQQVLYLQQNNNNSQYHSRSEHGSQISNAGQNHHLSSSNNSNNRSTYHANSLYNQITQEKSRSNQKKANISYRYRSMNHTSQGTSSSQAMPMRQSSHNSNQYQLVQHQYGDTTPNNNNLINFNQVVAAAPSQQHSSQHHNMHSMDKYYQRFVFSNNGLNPSKYYSTHTVYNNNNKDQRKNNNTSASHSVARQ